MYDLKERQEYLLHIGVGIFEVEAGIDNKGIWTLIDFDSRLQFQVAEDGEILDAEFETPQPIGATVRDLRVLGPF